MKQRTGGRILYFVQKSSISSLQHFMDTWWIPLTRLIFISLFFENFYKLKAAVQLLLLHKLPSQAESV